MLKNKILNILNNENAGPNVETIITIGMSLLVMGGIYFFLRQVWNWVYSASLIVKCYD